MKQAIYQIKFGLTFILQMTGIGYGLFLLRANSSLSLTVFQEIINLLVISGFILFINSVMWYTLHYFIKSVRGEYIPGEEREDE